MAEEIFIVDKLSYIRCSEIVQSNLVASPWKLNKTIGEDWK